MPAPPKRYKVGEIMRHTGLSRQTIHNYTMLGLISPVERTEAGHRLYDESVFDRIRRIELLKIHRTLNEIREMLEEEDRKSDDGQQE
ncbi:MAG: MerR family DNA-binding transcriptional regulator [Planctomycetes bacterium]|nr:MerR family DNA-binding transcriptional regulator [Planctomycetota bacterium]